MDKLLNTITAALTILTIAAWGFIIYMDGWHNIFMNIIG